MEAWERQRDEPAKWFGRFDQFFRPAGTDRSLRGAYQAWREQERPEMSRVSNGVSEAWQRNAKRWDWKARAEAWDEAERVKRLKEEEAEGTKWRKRRRELLAAFYARTAQALQGLETSLVFDKDGALVARGPTMSQVTNAVRTAADQLRAEYDDEPTQKVEHSGAVLQRVEVVDATGKGGEMVTDEEDEGGEEGDDGDDGDS